MILLTIMSAWMAAAESVELVDTLSMEWANRTDSVALKQKPLVVETQVVKDEGLAPARFGTETGNGSLSGRVRESASGRPLSQAMVVLSGTGKSTATDGEGRWEFVNLSPGVYGVLVAAAGFDPWTAESLLVVTGRDRRAEAGLDPRALREERVAVTGQASRRTESALLFARREAPTVSDGVSAEQMSKGPDGDASAAARRVTGLSIGGDGLVYVRGLGERYVNVQLNGLTLSSPDPEKRVIPLDLFPTRLLDGLDVAKTFTPEQPGEFAGGSVQIRTREAPDRRLLEVTAGMALSPGTTGQKIWGYEGGDLDWLGFDDGSRALPSSLPEGRFSNGSTSLGATRAERKIAMKKIIDGFTNVWNPREETAPLNQSYGMSAGNRHRLGDDWSLGWLAGGTWSGSWDRSEEARANVGLQADSSFTRIEGWSRDRSTQSVLAGALGTTTLRWKNVHALTLTSLWNRTWDDQVVRTFGLRSSDPDTTLTWEIRNQNQTLGNLQLRGRHGASKDGAHLDWTLARSLARRDEPDLRTSRLVRTEIEDEESGETRYSMLASPTGGLQDRWWYFLREQGSAGRVALDLPNPLLGNGSRLDMGVFHQDKRRKFTVQRITFVPNFGRIPLEEVEKNGYEAFWDFLDGSTDSGYIENALKSNKDDYAVRDRQSATWLGSQTRWTSWFRTGLGARWSLANVEGTAADQLGNLSQSERAVANCDSGGLCTIPFGYRETSLLPSASAVFTQGERFVLRTGWTRTMAYPEYREMAPLLINQMVEGIEQAGNLELRPTRITNWDIRGEWYPGAKELVAISLFRKDFDQPVEALLQQVGSSARASFRNAEKADLEGIELEARVELSRIHGALTPFQIQSNWTGIRSLVDGERRRPLQGQAPYLFNAMLFSEFFDGAVQGALLYNRIGRRLGSISTTIFPDVYDESRESLDASVTWKMLEKTRIRFATRNLTDSPQRSTQGGVTVRRTAPGTTWSTSLTHAF